MQSFVGISSHLKNVSTRAISLVFSTTRMRAVRSDSRVSFERAILATRNNVTNISFFIFSPNVPGQTAEPWTFAFLRAINRLVCSRWLGSVVFFIERKDKLQI